MNKQVIFMNKKAVIVDELGNQQESLAYDNMESILIEENVIEIINNTIKDIKEELKELNEKINNFDLKKNRKLNYIILALLIACIGGIAISNPVIFSISLLSAGMTYLCKSTKTENKYNTDKRNALDCKLEYLEKILIEEQEKLVQLNIKKQEVSIPDELSILYVNEDKKIEELAKGTHACYKVGYNLDENYKRLQDGSLNSDLNEFDEEYKEFVKNYLETKGPSLTRKR